MLDVQQSIETIERWLSEVELASTHPQKTISSEEKKQLIATNKAVQQLGKLGVPIPDELRNLKLKLSALEEQPVVDSELQITIKSIDSVISSLHSLLFKAKVIRQKLGAKNPSNKNEICPKQYFGISLGELLEKGAICIDATLELQLHKNGEIFKGKLTDNGYINVQTNSGWQEYKTLSTAASKIAGRAVNGWAQWKIVESDGSRITLEAVRERYINER